jgi:hypothetical protein
MDPEYDQKRETIIQFAQFRAIIRTRSMRQDLIQDFRSAPATIVQCVEGKRLISLEHHDAEARIQL